MKELKLNKQGIVAAYVITAVLFALGIFFLVLPDDVYYATGDSNPDVGRYVWFVLFEFCALIALIKTLKNVTKQKKIITEYNALRDKCGENAFFVGGYCKAIEQDNHDAIKTTVSILGAAASAVIFGWGVYKIFSKDITRLFLFCDDGLYVICSSKHKQIFLTGKMIKTATLTENAKGQIELACPNENFVLIFDTLRIDVSNDELTQKLKTLFFAEDRTN